MKRLFMFFMLIFLVSGCSIPSTKKEIAEEYWPTEKWKVSTPEEQGINSSKLVEMFEALEENNSPLEGLLIIRNGYIVAERYSPAYGQDSLHPINSVTKSITAALTGIAIDEGEINLEDKVLDYFPNLNVENMDEYKNTITVKQLLTMSSGVDWPELEKDRYRNLWMEFESSDDPVQYVLSRPVVENMKNKFNYSTGDFHVMSAIIQESTGMKTHDYAKEKLFSKIGITKSIWPEQRGVNTGGYKMMMVPRDMARFGYLYMNNGKWDGEQIISEDWVKASMESQVEARTDGEYYGYGFWVMNTKEGYLEVSAMGDRGQYIIMVPELDLLIVQTSSDWGEINIYEDYIYPAIESDEPIKLDEKANERLKELTSTEK